MAQSSANFFGQPAIYRIKIAGVLEQDWSGKLAGMQLIVHREDETHPFTSLTGEVADQAALNGILNSLYELHFPIISVNCIDPCTDHKSDKP